MAKIRSVFITLYSSMVFLSSLYFGAMLVRAPSSVKVLSLLTAAPMAIFLGIILLGKAVPRTSAMLWSVTLPTLGAALWLARNYRLHPIEPAQILLPALLVLGYGLYLLWYSKIPPRKKNVLRVGYTLPDFRLTESDGTRVSSQDLSHSKALWIFYRGNWCPLCMAQIKEIAAQYQSLAERSVALYLISPQSQAHTEQLAHKFALPMRFLRDDGNAVARLLGIAMPNGLPFGMTLLGYDAESVMPTVMITDEQGHLRWIHQTDNYRLRPEPASFFKVLEQLERGERVSQPDEVSAYWNGVLIARSSNTVVVEGHHYFPQADVNPDYLKASPSTSVCPWKGLAHYHHLSVNGTTNPDAAWFYPSPSPLAAKIKHHIAFWKGVEVRP